MRKLRILPVFLGFFHPEPKAGCAGGNQGRTLTIRVKTELVELRTTVADRQGHPIENLTKEDFELRLDGKPRSIDFFPSPELKIPKSQPESLPGYFPDPPAEYAP